MAFLIVRHTLALVPADFAGLGHIAGLSTGLGGVPPGNLCMKLGLVLEEIQMSPRLLGRVMDLAAPRATEVARKRSALFEIQIDKNGLRPLC